MRSFQLDDFEKPWYELGAGSFRNQMKAVAPVCPDLVLVNVGPNYLD